MTRRPKNHSSPEGVRDTSPSTSETASSSTPTPAPAPRGQAWVRAAMDGQARGPRASLYRLTAACLEPAYRAAIAARNGAYDAGLKKAHSLGRPVISVGNITTGGTGKTPIVIDLARRMHTAGHRPAVLLRGYHSETSADESAAENAAAAASQYQQQQQTQSDEQASTQSDEAAVLTGELPGIAHVEPDPDRVAAARRVLDARPDTTMFLLDDGFQHRRAARDFDILLINAGDPFGFGRLLPRGLLREPLASLRRADAVVVTRSDTLDESARATLAATIEKHHGRPPVAWTSHVWAGFQCDTTEAARSAGHSIDIAQGDHINEIHNLADLAGQRVVGVVGLGDPDAFNAQLRAAGANVVDFIAFDDHHHYTDDELASVADVAKRHQAVIVTSEKDWVKWRRRRDALHGAVVLRPRLNIRWLTGGEELTAALLQVAPPPPSQRPHQPTEPQI